VLILTRENQDRHKGFSFKPVVAFGENSGNPFYYPEEDSSEEITKKKLLIIDFGTQYLDGTTRISRTIHFGKPTREQKRIYTTILAGLIRLSLHVFPEKMLVSGVDVLIREPMWRRKEKYEVLGSGIGSYLDADEGQFFGSCFMNLLQFLFLQHPSTSLNHLKKILSLKTETFSMFH
jgi:Xaa-Pro aminopeptidase